MSHTHWLPNTLLRVRQAGQSLRQHHPVERFANTVRACLDRTRGAEAMPPAKRQSLNSCAFHLCVRRTVSGREVIKRTRGDNRSSCALLQHVSNRARFANYRRTLLEMPSDPWLGKHTASVHRVRTDGGYDGEYIEGVNLAQLRTDLLRSPESVTVAHADLRSAIAVLLTSLRSYHSAKGALVGDWAFHNLVFDPVRRVVINVDAKEFCPELRTTDFRLNDIDKITANFADLNSLMTLAVSRDDDDRRIRGVLRVLDEVRHSGESYSGVYFLAGYHTLHLRGRRFRGQRECFERLAGVPFEFRQKVVVDFGCNCGGMLHALAPRIARGYGFDFNPNCVNAAHVVSELNGSANLAFYTFDLDRQDLRLLPAFLPNGRADICLLLSVCMWITKWRDVIDAASRLANTLLFESNGTIDEQNEQLSVVRSLYDDVRLLSDTSSDDPLVGLRRLFLCQRPLESANDTRMNTGAALAI